MTKDTKNQLNPAETLYAFCGWLTTRDQKTVMSAKHCAGEIAVLIKEFSESNGLDAPREDWHKNIQQPSLHILIQDDDSHWYVIPASKKHEWFSWCESDEYMDGITPDYAKKVGGGASQVEFGDYQIK